MKTAFVQVKTVVQARRECPWAYKCVKVEGGYQCFESEQNYNTWKSQR